MRLYEKTFEGESKGMMSAGDSPLADQVPKEFLGRILNAQLGLPGGVFHYKGD